MACLSKEQIDFIRKDLKKRNVSRSFLFEEWVDHVCCDVETMINKGMTFEEAYGKVTGESGDEALKSAHRDIQQFMNHRYVGIKKLLLLAFLVYAAGWIINLRGGINLIGLASFLVLCIVYLRIALDFFGKRFVNRINILLGTFSFLAFLGTLSGILLIFLNRNFGMGTRGHGVDFTVFGWFFFSLGCLIYYIREYRSSIERREMKKVAWFVALAIFNVFLSAVSIATFPLYRFAEKYLFYLIGFILGYNALAILALLFTRSLKNTLILSLVIGSFMIVFIHSPFRSRLPGGKPKMSEITLTLNAGIAPDRDKLYITMYYDRFPDRPITLPLRKTGPGTLAITMPSYPYKGYLYYSVAEDSIGAREYLGTNPVLDSLALNVPRNKNYELKYLQQE